MNFIDNYYEMTLNAFTSQRRISIGTVGFDILYTHLNAYLDKYFLERS